MRSENRAPFSAGSSQRRSRSCNDFRRHSLVSLSRSSANSSNGELPVAERCSSHALSSLRSLSSATINSGRSGRLPPLRADECSGGAQRCFPLRSPSDGATQRGEAADDTAAYPPPRRGPIRLWPVGVAADRWSSNCGGGGEAGLQRDRWSPKRIVAGGLWPAGVAADRRRGVAWWPALQLFDDGSLRRWQWQIVLYEDGLADSGIALLTVKVKSELRPTVFVLRRHPFSFGSDRRNRATAFSPLSHCSSGGCLASSVRVSSSEGGRRLTAFDLQGRGSVWTTARSRQHAKRKQGTILPGGSSQRRSRRVQRLPASLPRLSLFDRPPKANNGELPVAERCSSHALSSLSLLSPRRRSNSGRSGRLPPLRADECSGGAQRCFPLRSPSDGATQRGEAADGHGGIPSSVTLDDLVDPRLERNFVAIDMFRMIEVAAACVRH
nr:proline-rich receptor-like protein kinase PERK8 [Ipomoea batatas]